MEVQEKVSVPTEDLGDKVPFDKLPADFRDGLVQSVIESESGGDPNAVSPKGAQGLMQLMPATGKALGLKNPFDPEENVRVGTKYLGQLIDKYGAKDGLVAYNWGPGNVDKHGVEKAPKQSHDYADKILARVSAATEELGDVVPKNKLTKLGESADASDLSKLVTFKEKVSKGVKEIIEHPLDSLVEGIKNTLPTLEEERAFHLSRRGGKLSAQDTVAFKNFQDKINNIAFGFAFSGVAAPLTKEFIGKLGGMAEKDVAKVIDRVPERAHVSETPKEAIPEEKEFESLSVHEEADIDQQRVIVPALERRPFSSTVSVRKPLEAPREAESALPAAEHSELPALERNGQAALPALFKKPVQAETKILETLEERARPILSALEREPRALPKHPFIKESQVVIPEPVTGRDTVHIIPSPEAFARSVRFKTPALTRQRGYMSPLLAASILKGSIGAAAGAFVDDDPVEGAVLGAAITLGGSAIRSKLTRSIRARAIANRIPQLFSDALHTMSNESDAIALKNLSFIKKNTPQDYSKFAEEIYFSREGGQLSQRGQELSEKLVKPLEAQNAAIREELRGLQVDVGADVDKYVHRIPVTKPKLNEQISGWFDPRPPRSLGTFASALQERQAFALEGENGRRLVGLLEKDGDKFALYENGKMVASKVPVVQKEWRTGIVDWKGARWLRDQATTKEIEANTPVRYAHDALSAAAVSNRELTDALLHARTIEQLKQLPEFDNIAVEIGEEAPRGWRTVDIPQLKGYKFDKRVAEVLDDFAGQKGSSAVQVLGRISRFMVGSMFWNPLIHIYNVLLHGVVERGLTSWLSPAGYVRLADSSSKAWRSVTSVDDNFVRYLKEGAGFMSTRNRLRDFSTQVLDALGTNPKMGAVAQAWGYANPTEMVRRIYSSMNKTLWVGNDVILMRGFLEREAAGMSAKEVIASVERHIPNYRIPTRVAFDNSFGRFTGDVLKNPLLTAFGRYDYGRLHSFGEMAKDLVSKDTTVKEKAKALDQIAMLAVLEAFIYPVFLDTAAKAITGNKNATAGRYGPSTITHMAYAYMHGDKDFHQLVESVVPLAPILPTTVELTTGRNLFTGKEINTPSEAAELLARKISPLSSTLRIEKNETTPEQFAFSSIGINAPSSIQAQHREVQRQRRLEKRKNVDFRRRER